MSDSLERKERVVYKVVLTGGPCAGKTTTVARLRFFFENLGWKVYSVPEAATILLHGMKFAELSQKQVDCFQKNVLKTIIQLETTYFDLAEEETNRNVLVVCDRGTMDPSAFCSDECWSSLISSLGYDLVQLRDARYNQVIHLMTAANGAEEFYQLGNNPTRSEGLELARHLDNKAALAWIGHPYYDAVDNTTDFENKIRRVIELLCKGLGKHLGAEIDDRLQAQSKKRKFLIKCLPGAMDFPKVQNFDVQHDYLLSSCPATQVRIRKRGQNGHYMYTLTERMKVKNERVEQIRQLSSREYKTLYKQRDHTHHTIHKIRKCFLSDDHYYHLDIFEPPWSKRCEDVIMLETYTTKKGNELQLPDFLDVVKEVTNDPHYSMYYLSAH